MQISALGGRGHRATRGWFESWRWNSRNSKSLSRACLKRETDRCRLSHASGRREHDQTKGRTELRVILVKSRVRPQGPTKTGSWALMKAIYFVIKVTVAKVHRRRRGASSAEERPRKNRCSTSAATRFRERETPGRLEDQIFLRR